MESVISASIIVLVIRTFKPFYKSRPSFYLLGAVLAIVLITLSLPYTPLAPYLGFQVLPLHFFAYIAAIVFGYIYAMCEFSALEIGRYGLANLS